MGVTLSPKASLDLAAIFNYSLQVWGAEQAGRYLARLFSGLDLLVDTPYLGRQLGGRLGAIRILNIGEHIAYYQIRSSGVYVIRVLHPKQQVVLTPEE